MSGISGDLQQCIDECKAALNELNSAVELFKQQTNRVALSATGTINEQARPFQKQGNLTQNRRGSNLNAGFLESNAQQQPVATNSSKGSSKRLIPEEIKLQQITEGKRAEQEKFGEILEAKRVTLKDALLKEYCKQFITQWYETQPNAEALNFKAFLQLSKLSYVLSDLGVELSTEEHAIGNNIESIKNYVLNKKWEEISVLDKILAKKLHVAELFDAEMQNSSKQGSVNSSSAAADMQEPFKFDATCDKLRIIKQEVLSAAPKKRGRLFFNSVLDTSQSRSIVGLISNLELYRNKLEELEDLKKLPPSWNASMSEEKRHMRELDRNMNLYFLELDLNAIKKHVHASIEACTAIQHDGLKKILSTIFGKVPQPLAPEQVQARASVLETDLEKLQKMDRTGRIKAATSTTIDPGKKKKR